jgi:hypothetical protein
MFFTIRADHIIMMKMIRSSCPKFKPTEYELSSLSDLFVRIGGSWIRIFNGSSDDLYYLRKMIKNYAKLRTKFKNKPYKRNIRKKRKSRV